MTKLCIFIHAVHCHGVVLYHFICLKRHCIRVFSFIHLIVIYTCMHSEGYIIRLLTSMHVQKVAYCSCMINIYTLSVIMNNTKRYTLRHLRSCMHRTILATDITYVMQ